MNNTIVADVGAGLLPSIRTPSSLNLGMQIRRTCGGLQCRTGADTHCECRQVRTQVHEPVLSKWSREDRTGGKIWWLVKPWSVDIVVEQL